MPHIIPIKDLKNTTLISEMCHQTNEPIFVTKNGYEDLVMMSVHTYESLFKRLEMYKDLILSERQFDEGQYSDAKESLNNIRNKYGL